MGVVNEDKRTLETTFDGTWIQEPDNSSNVSDGARDIRHTRRAAVALVSQEHHVETDGDNLPGMHVEGSARVFVRDDGTVPTADVEKGRVVADTSTRSLKVSDGESFLPFGGVYPGLITMSAVAPTPSTDLWALCDGDYVERGSDSGIWDPLIDRLASSTADGAYLPDLRDRFVRGADTAGNGSTALKSGARSVNTQTDAASADDAFDFQEHAFEDHDHRLDHTHGKKVSSGHDTGDGRTGTVDSWTAGTPELSNDGDHQHDYIKPGNAGSARDGSLSRERTEDAETTGDATHNHAIPRAYGLTGLASEQAEDSQHGIPEREFNTASETRPDNVVLYFVIKL